MRRILPVKARLFFAFFLIIALTLPPLVNLFVGRSYAGALSPIKLQINNSQAGATGVTYGFFWTTAVTTSIKQIDIKICTTAGSFTDSCTVPTGFSPGTPTLASDNIAGTGRTVSDPDTSGIRFRVVVTTPATQATQTMQLTFTGVTNSTTTNTTFFARARTFSDTGTTEIDSGQAASATLDTTSIAVSATVDANFSFSIAAVSSGGNFNGGTGNVNVTSTTTTIPFGTLVAATPKIAAHDVTVTTNAGSGYTVTASHSATIAGNPPLTSGSTNNIDAFTGTNTTPTTWSSPNGSTANTNTGFFGYSTEDATLCTGTAARFTSGGAKWAGSTTTGDEAICATAGVSSQTTRLGWELEVNTVQPAGTYTGTVILIATPTY